MRCIIVGDSMAMPTMELKYSETWVYLLKQDFPQIDIIDKSRRSSSVRRLIPEGQNSKGYDLLEFYSPNIVILQLGITDVAPRLLHRESLITKCINHLPPPISKLIYNVVRKVKGRTISCADVKPNEFYFCLSERKVHTESECTWTRI